MDSNELSVTLDASKELKVLDLKKEIHKKINLEPQRQRLIFQGKALKDNDTLKSYKIEDNQVIHLVARSAAQQ